MDHLACFRRDLESERSMKIHALQQAFNPLEQELLERELAIIDAQIGWLDETIARKIA